MDRTIKLIRTNSNNADFKSLIFELNKDLFSLYGNLQNEIHKNNTLAYLDTAIVAYVEKKPVGCGCFKKVDTETIEIKRMFVAKHNRGKGISKLILKKLETWASEKGYKKAILETAKKQVEAINLYINSGYKEIEKYDNYASHELSICMAKDL